MIVERTHYFARPGLAAEVLATRRRACDIRLALGLAAGSIRIRAEGAPDGPDVAWECAFADAEAHRADLAARAASPDFEAVRKSMREIIARFERLFEARDTGETPASALDCVPKTLEFVSGSLVLKGQLWLPPGRGPFPAIVYNHGSGLKEPHEDNALPGLPLLFASWGYACLVPHRRGYGLSPGPDWRSECPGEPFSAPYNRAIIARLEREAGDVVAAFNYLARLKQIDAGRIALMGSSFGGTTTLLAAAREPRARAAIAFAMAAMNWDRNPLMAERLVQAVLEAKPPLFLAQARNDFSVRPLSELSAALDATAKPHVARLYPAFGATAYEGHFLAGRGSLIWGGDVRHFLEGALR